MELPEEIFPEGEEIKQKHLHVTTTNNPWIDLHKYSSFSNVKRIVAWICRFVVNKFFVERQLTCPLTTLELRNAEIILCKLAQRESFSEEISSLKNGKAVRKSSHIYKLTPVLDKEGVIRLDGRIRRSTVVPVDAKQPIILPKNHILSKLVVS